VYSFSNVSSIFICSTATGTDRYSVVCGAFWEVCRYFSCVIKHTYGSRTRRSNSSVTKSYHRTRSWAIPIHVRYIHLNVILPSPSQSSNWTLSNRFPHQNSISFLVSILATCPAHRNLLHFAALTVIATCTYHKVPRYVIPETHHLLLVS